MNLLVASAMQKNRNCSTSRFRNRMMCITKIGWDGSITKIANAKFSWLYWLNLRACWRLQPFDTSNNH